LIFNQIFAWNFSIKHSELTQYSSLNIIQIFILTFLFPSLCKILHQIFTSSNSFWHFLIKNSWKFIKLHKTFPRNIAKRSLIKSKTCKISGYKVCVTVESNKRPKVETLAFFPHEMAIIVNIFIALVNPISLAFQPVMWRFYFHFVCFVDISGYLWSLAIYNIHAILLIAWLNAKS
jgi:hypothetical protein